MLLSTLKTRLDFRRSKNHILRKHVYLVLYIHQTIKLMSSMKYKLACAYSKDSVAQSGQILSSPPIETKNILLPKVYLSNTDQILSSSPKETMNTLLPKVYIWKTDQILSSLPKEMLNTLLPIVCILQTLIRLRRCAA